MALAALQRDYPAVEAPKPNTLGSPRYGSQKSLFMGFGAFSVENAVKKYVGVTYKSRGETCRLLRNSRSLHARKMVKNTKKLSLKPPKNCPY